MTEINIKVVKDEDCGLLSPCGIICLGCDSYRGEGIEAAKKILDIWEGFNFLDTAGFVGLNVDEIQTTINALKKYVANAEASGNCKGCYHGGGPSDMCGISKCVKSKGYWTCAECEDYDPDSDAPCTSNVGDETVLPLSSSMEMSKLICKRYNANTRENLKQCRDIGYPEFIAEIKQKVDDGWRTWQVISSDMVFTDYVSGRSDK